MQMQAKLFGIVLCALAAAACGGDGGQNGGDGGGSTVAGIVSSWVEPPNNVVVANVTVAVLDTQISDTTDANGRFTLENVPNGTHFITTTVNGYWGYVDWYIVPDETAGREIELVVVPDNEIERWEGILGRPIPATQGAVDILYEDALGGETATITPAAGDDAFTFSGWDPGDQTTLIVDDDGIGELVFTSADPANETIIPMVNGVSGESCGVYAGPSGLEHPIFAKYITLVYAYCEAL